MKQNVLSVGAGKEQIALTDRVFPTPDKFSGVHDKISVRVLLIENGIRFALVTLDWVMIEAEEVKILKKIVSEKCAVLEDNIWICPTHTLSTPHFPPKHRREEDEVEARTYRLLMEAVKMAAARAADKAFKSLRPAILGSCKGRCLVNTNRNIETEKGWWLGSNDAGSTDNEMQVIRFDDIKGVTIALLYVVNCQPAVMDDSFLEDGTRLVSGDIAGISAEFIEREYPESMVAMWCTGAGADEWPLIRSKNVIRGLDGVLRTEDLGEKGFLIAQMLGSHIGQQVIMAAEKIKCSLAKGEIKVKTCEFTYASRENVPKEEMHPHLSYAFKLNGTADTKIEFFTLEDIALIGVQPEIGADTEKNIRSLSPYRTTAVITFVNGGAKYIADNEQYSLVTYQAMASKYAPGGAEKMMSEIAATLNELHA